jgi:hypothetical protein
MSNIETGKWRSDLTKDIRVQHGSIDDMDPVFKFNEIVFTTAVKWQTPPAEFTKDNQAALRKAINQCVINGIQPRTFLEIGVHNNDEESSTGVIFQNLPKNGIYLGVDIKDKSYLDDPSKGIFTIRESSSNYAAVKNKLENLGVTSIDFIFIDGWHSINQVYMDWEYVNLLSPLGVVAMHDVTYHLGPYNFIRNLDKSLWVVEENLCPQDYGLGYCFRKFKESEDLVSHHTFHQQDYILRIEQLEKELSQERITTTNLVKAISILANKQ